MVGCPYNNSLLTIETGRFYQTHHLSDKHLTRNINHCEVIRDTNTFDFQGWICLPRTNYPSNHLAFTSRRHTVQNMWSNKGITVACNFVCKSAFIDLTLKTVDLNVCQGSEYASEWICFTKFTDQTILERENFLLWNCNVCLRHTGKLIRYLGLHFDLNLLRS